MNKPLLTLDDVETWKARKVELESVIQSAEQELQEIVRKLTAAEMFMKPAKIAPAATAPVPQDQNGANDASPTLGDRLVAIAARSPSGFTPLEMRDTLRAEGFDMAGLDANTSYLYTLLGRLVKRGRLEKRRGKYRLAQRNPSQDGTGAVAAPVRH